MKNIGVVGITEEDAGFVSAYRWYFSLFHQELASFPACVKQTSEPLWWFLYFLLHPPSPAPNLAEEL